MRRAIIQMTPELFVGQFTPGVKSFKCLEPLEDVTLVGIRLNQTINPPLIEAVVQSPSLDDVVEGGALPFIRPSFRSLGL